ncbi:MAG: GDP-mannose 4,6-dehydratase [Gammaproteobacteria bacterium RIFOXYA12_FULL_61_12]|nr:MAG: GDP-mannose 4,6-dehydratase [Gammaproteobacteria bacterium RIFOXYD12_FULL_61_37]OGT93510.1 MAG: GDP-mannose 4,6-dehydratase [Gammaproteobacteria bacterium RIFOXYA12_FULL_61_12]
MSQKSALIFGVSGQDGAYLARLLLNKGYAVHGTSRDAEMSSFSSLVALGVRDRVAVHSAALTDFRSTLQLIAKVDPDEIYNLSGQSSVGLSFQQPVETLESIATATLNVLESIRFLGHPVRFYNAGSSECFGDTGGVAADERTPFRPRSPYGVAKSTAYWEVANYRDSYSLFACSGILFNHESMLRPACFVTRKVAMAAARIALGSTETLTVGDLSIERDWGWAPEYVDAMWAMLQQPEPDDFVIATGRHISLQSFVEKCFASLRLDWRKHVRQDKSLFRPSEIRSGCGRPDKAARLLAWTARTTAEEVAARMATGEMRRLQGLSVEELLC